MGVVVMDELKKAWGIKTRWEWMRENRIFDEHAALLEICKRIEKIEDDLWKGDADGNGN
jgi:hypothetical protein